MSLEKQQQKNTEQKNTHLAKLKLCGLCCAHNRLQSFSISLFCQNLTDVPIWSTNLKFKLITIIVAGRWFL